MVSLKAVLLVVCTLDLTVQARWNSHASRRLNTTRHRHLAERQAVCVHGEWSCAGQNLQRCVYDKVETVQICDAGMTCRAQGTDVGCRWAVSGQGAATTTSPVPIDTSQNNSKAGTPAPAPAAVLVKQDENPSQSPVRPRPPLKENQSPHYVSYYNGYHGAMLPSAAEMGAFNRLILAFWIPESGGPVDAAKHFTMLSAEQRQATLDAYRKAGIVLMASFGGETSLPVQNKVDAVQAAQDFAKFIKDYELDGADVNFEDLDAMNKGLAEDWIISFHRKLRALLPKPYLISHAPLAPWFMPGRFPGGAYTRIHKEIGDDIDFYNVQFYNQGPATYTDCEGLLNTSPTPWPGSSVFEIHQNIDVPLDKIVIGKPITRARAGSGFMEDGLLGTCVKQAKAKSWSGGLMFWEWAQNLTVAMGA